MKRRSLLLSTICLALRNFFPRALKAQTEFDFRLQSNSPAIRTGVLLSEVSTDIKGNQRGNPPSCGAYEYISTQTQKPPAPSSVQIK
jgi:hypothetical protein